MQSVYAGTPWIIAKIAFLLHGELKSSDEQIYRKKCKTKVRIEQNVQSLGYTFLHNFLIFGFCILHKNVNLGLINHCAMVKTAMRESVDII